MGTECIGTRVDDADIVPSIPPGFGSLATFTLQRIQEDAPRVQENALASVCNSCSPQDPMNADESKSDGGRLKKSLRHRPWINYSQFDNSSEEDESDSEQIEQDIPRIKFLPKGVIRGCSECKDCQKVTAQWRPQDACRPILDDAPVFYPTEEEFKDTLKYIASIRLLAEPYGICRIVPPTSWNPPCPLKEKHVWENSMFNTRIQKMHKLQNRDSVKITCKNLSMMRRKRRKILKDEDEFIKNYENTIDTNVLGYHNSTERFGFEPGPDFSLQSFEKYANDFKEQYFQTKYGANFMPGQSEPSPENIEGEYWRIVERPTEEIEVLYGADLETGEFGSGFPKASSDGRASESEDQYVKSGWNLNNFPRLPGSVLSFESGDISGVLVPWLYVGMCFSSFCWHVEDHHLYSLNYLHWGAPKMWYGVPGRDALKLEAAMKKHLADLFEEQPDLLHNLVTQFSPSLLKKEGVPVYRCLQHAGEFVLTFPRAYHSGFNCGFNCAEAVNVAPIDWLPHGLNAVELYREQVRKISISHDKLLLGAAREVVRAQWNISFLGKSSADSLRWREACGGDGILAKSLKDRVEMERIRRDFLGSSQARKMDAGFDVNCERECVVCHYDLHLSAVGCACSQDRYACLTHAKDLCSCDWSTRFFLFRYEINELNTLVDALGGKLSAVHRWGLLDLGLRLSSVAAREKTPESKQSREKTPVFKQSHEKTPESRPSRDKTPESKWSPNRSTSLHATNQKNMELCHGNFSSGYRISSSPQEFKASILPESSFQVQIERQKIAVNLNECQGSFTPGSGISVNLKSQEGFTSNPHTQMVSSPIFLDSSRIGDLQNSMLTGKKYIPGHHEIILLDTDENEKSLALPPNKVKKESLAENAESLSRLTSMKKATNCNSLREPVLVTRETNASLICESDNNLIGKADSGSHPASAELNSQPGGQPDLPSQFMMRPFQGKPSHLENFPDGPIPKHISNLGASKQENNCSSTNTQSKLVEMVTSAKTDEDTKEKYDGTTSTVNLIDGGDAVTISPSCAPGLDRHNRLQKGPRVAKVIRKFNCNVEPLEYGVVLSGKLWSTSQIIFPKGYRSRVRYFNILDPTQMCYYVSEILDAGLLGPLFMVRVEKCPSEVFFHASATKCWDMVREKVNNEIRRQRSMGKTNLPTPQPPGSLDGLEMFGLTSPVIIQAIEAIDQHHCCTEYWRSRPQPPPTVCSTTVCKDQQLRTDQGMPAGASVLIRGLLKKGDPEELRALQRFLCSDDPARKKELTDLLEEEIGRSFR